MLSIIFKVQIVSLISFSVPTAPSADSVNSFYNVHSALTAHSVYSIHSVLSAHSGHKTYNVS